MNLIGMLKRGDKLDKAFEDLQIGMLDVLDEDLFSLSDATQPADGENSSNEAVAPEETRSLDLPESNPEPAPRMSSHAQSRLAALESLEELHRGAQDHLENVGAGLSEIVTAHHLTREFLNAVHSDIHRASEFETANAALASENRKLSEQLHDSLKKQQELETTLEALRRRESGLLQDRDALRVELSSAKLENVELGNTLAKSESERGDLVKTLSTRTLDAERRLRENEVLREKQINLSIDLEKSLKREAEIRRKFDEISTAHTGEAARHRETLAALTRSEKEIIRLQKQFEIAQAKQVETSEAAISREAESEAESKRSLAEIRGLKEEIQSLNARLETASTDRAEASDEVARLKAQLDDLGAEKQIAQEMIASLKREGDADKKSLTAANASLSNMNLQQASEQMQIDTDRDGGEKLQNKIEDLTAQIDKLKGEVKHLKPYERLYREAKAKREAENGAETAATDAASKKKETDANVKH